MKKKGPKHDQLTQLKDAISTLPFEVEAETLERPSSRVLWIRCPHCHDLEKAYLWSISGGGKRCQCGALLTRSGDAHHWKKGAQ